MKKTNLNLLETQHILICMEVMEVTILIFSV